MYEDVVKRLRRMLDWELCDYDHNFKFADETIAEAADAIEVLTTVAKGYKRSMEAWADEAANAQPRWIPVTEQLPIRGDRVICFGDNGINTVDFVCGDKWCALPWFYLDGEQETGVTHWMPLPEPPKEETK